jgi:hypothetical protein
MTARGFPMSRLAPYLAALALVVGSGVAHALRTDRWSPSHSLEARVAELGRVPADVGGWRGRDSTLDRATVRVAGLSGYLMRVYKGPGGDVLTVLVICGRPGPVAAHTPEICYPGEGYEQVGRTEKTALPDGSGFWLARFRKPGPVEDQGLSVLYSFNAGGGWKASDNARVDFAGSPALNKVYVVRRTGPAPEAGREDPSVEFLKEFLPQLRKYLFSTRG